MSTGMLILLILTVIYIIILALQLTGRLNKDYISLYGPFIMLKTEKGKKTIDRIASKKKFWKAYGTFSLWVVIASSFLMFVVLLWQTTFIAKIPEDKAPTPQMMIGLPGLNPLIPIWYGILGLAVAMVVHEFAHGILTRVADGKVKKLGLLYLIVPMGAFVEPDEEEVEKFSKKKRTRMFAVGPATNIFIAFIVVIVFARGFMGSLDSEENGMVVLKVSKDLPADETGIEPGMVITYMDETRIDESEDFLDFLDGTKEGQNVNITVLNEGNITIFRNITLENRYNYTGLDKDKGKGYLGVSTPATVEGLRNILAHPFQGKGPAGILGASLFYISLPFFQLSPFPETIQELYTIQGPLSFLPEPVFWIAANSLYWIFWLNLMVGITNSLPAVPLDGGYIFRDGLDKIVKKHKPGLSKEKREKYVVKLSNNLAYLILLLITMPLFVPRILGILF